MLKVIYNYLVNPTYGRTLRILAPAVVKTKDPLWNYWAEPLAWGRPAIRIAISMACS